MQMKRALGRAVCWAILAAGMGWRVGVARGDALPASSIPAEAGWVMHLDVDAVRASPLWEIFNKKFVEPRKEEFAGRQRWIEAATGTNMQKELHDLTLFGTTFNETSVCLLIHAPMDQARVTSLLKGDPEFKTTVHNGHTIMSWRDNDKVLYGSFAAGEMAVLGRSSKMVAMVLDTMDGKSPALNNERLLPVAATTMAGEGQVSSPMLWMAAINLSDLSRAQKVDSPFMLQIDTASVAIGATRERLSARMAVLAKSEKAAQQLMAAADGVKAMIALAAADERARPQVRTLGSALQSLTLTMDGKDVTANWSVELEKLDSMLEVVRLQPKPATGQATTTRRGE